MQQHDELFTYTLSGAASFTTDVNWGIDRMSVMCISDDPITVTGTRTLGSYASAPITLSKGESFTWEKSNGMKQPIVITGTGPASEAIITAI
jgi:hypothetical protein